VNWEPPLVLTLATEVQGAFITRFPAKTSAAPKTLILFRRKHHRRVDGWQGEGTVTWEGSVERVVHERRVHPGSSPGPLVEHRVEVGGAQRGAEKGLGISGRVHSAESIRRVACRRPSRNRMQEPKPIYNRIPSPFQRFLILWMHPFIHVFHLWYPMQPFPWCGHTSMKFPNLSKQRRHNTTRPQ